jgi:hypothetical protein
MVPELVLQVPQVKRGQKEAKACVIGKRYCAVLEPRIIHSLDKIPFPAGDGLVVAGLTEVISLPSILDCFIEVLRMSKLIEGGARFQSLVDK